ncbi:MAG TPA: SprT family zinc-dependent metalloprotease [Moheibacter sp.]|nr:SprT family zinc-dependent metalloprotease [Moheibacter sp.]
MEQIMYKYGKKTIEADVKYSNRKTIDLRVFPEGNVEITAPLETEISLILSKVKTKSKWIIDQQKSFELYKPYTTKRLYVSGETHRYLGRQYKLQVEDNVHHKTGVSFSKGLLVVNAKNEADVEKQLRKFYSNRASIIFNEILEKILEEFSQFKNYEISLKHRFLTKRWGSCSTNGNILLNTELIKASKSCIEYVLLHELCHLKHANHSKAFYSMLNGLMPEWEKLKLKLEKDLS